MIQEGVTASSLSRRDGKAQHAEWVAKKIRLTIETKTKKTAIWK